MPRPLIHETNEERAFQLANLSVMPAWVAMIVAPRSALTARIVRWSDAIVAGLAAAYVAQFAALIVTADERPTMGAVASLREGMGKPDGFLVGWTHFLAFDLFVGRWIWRTAVAEDRSCRLALFLTLMAGPAGLGLFGLQRRGFGIANP